MRQPLSSQHEHLTFDPDCRSTGDHRAAMLAIVRCTRVTRRQPSAPWYGNSSYRGDAPSLDELNGNIVGLIELAPSTMTRIVVVVMRFCAAVGWLALRTSGWLICRDYRMWLRMALAVPVRTEAQPRRACQDARIAIVAVL